MGLNVLIIGGGSSDVGRDVTRILLKDKKFISSVAITSRNIHISKIFAEELKDPRIRVASLDVTDIQQLKKIIHGHDLVVNTTGPFSTNVISIIRASIEAKVNYIDICDDIDPTVEALQLDRFAKDAGTFVLLSMGWFPGMSNLRAKWLADQMDNVDEIVTAWVAGKKTADEKPSKGLAGIEHYLKALTGKIYTFRNGRRIKIPINRKGIKLSFLEPLGNYLCYQIEHPETATLPYIISGVQNASTLGSLYPPNRNKSIRFYTKLIDLKLLSIPFVTRLFGMYMRSKRKTSLPLLNASYIACIGTKNQEKGQLSYSEVNTNITTAEATSQPLACAILFIASNKNIEPGVHLPEAVITIEDIIKIGAQQNLSFVNDAVGKTTWDKEITSVVLNE